MAAGLSPLRKTTLLTVSPTASEQHTHLELKNTHLLTIHVCVWFRATLRRPHSCLFDVYFVNYYHPQTRQCGLQNFLTRAALLSPPLLHPRREATGRNQARCSGPRSRQLKPESATGRQQRERVKETIYKGNFTSYFMLVIKMSLL